MESTPASAFAAATAQATAQAAAPVTSASMAGEASANKLLRRANDSSVHLDRSKLQRIEERCAACVDAAPTSPSLLMQAYGELFYAYQHVERDERAHIYNVVARAAKRAFVLRGVVRPFHGFAAYAHRMSSAHWIDDAVRQQYCALSIPRRVLRDDAAVRCRIVFLCRTLALSPTSPFRAMPVFILMDIVRGTMPSGARLPPVHDFYAHVLRAVDRSTVGCRRRRDDDDDDDDDDDHNASGGSSASIARALSIMCQADHHVENEDDDDDNDDDDEGHLTNVAQF